jgi:hypothetical protein
MRDYAGEIYRVETGRPFSTVKGTRVSSGLTASQIDARDFLAARAAKRREDHAPTGPVVIFSGGTDWHDHELLWQALDETHARVPHMILATTAQHKGCDQIAHAWAAARGVKTVRFTLNRALGKRAGFVRNEQLMNLKPVHAIICEGSGLQSNLLSRVREANLPHHAFAQRHQRALPDAWRGAASAASSSFFFRWQEARGRRGGTSPPHAARLIGRTDCRPNWTAFCGFPFHQIAPEQRCSHPAGAR